MRQNFILPQLPDAPYVNLEQQVQEHTTNLAVVNARLQRETEERQQVEEALRRSEHQFRQLFEEMLSGFALHEIICDTHGQPVDYRFLTVNPAFEAMTGLKAGDLIGKCVREVLPQTEDHWVENYGRVALSNEPFQFENYSEALGKYFEGRAFCPEKGKFAVLFHDVTERKRSEEARRLDEARLEALLRFSTMTAASEKDITNFALEEGVRLTNSKIGYLHFINDDQITLQLFTWSKDVYKQCYTEKINHYPLEQAGVWADCVRQRRHVIHNDYQQLPDRKGYPEGHIPVVRHLSVPVLDGDQVVAVAGVGNKTEPYDKKDARQLSLFMNEMWALLQHKRAELAVQQLNAELEQRVQERTVEMEDLYNHAPCGYHSLDPNGLIIRINDTELHCLGYTREELVGRKHFTELLTENCRQIFQQSYLLLKERSWVKDLELEMIRKNGTTLPVLLSETAVRDTADRYMMSRSTVFNITDRKCAEEARRQSEERFRRYFELSLIGMAVTSPDKGWVEVNDRLCEILGYSRAELSRLTWVDVTHPDDLATAIDCFSRVMAGGTDGYSLDKRFIRKDGQIIYASVSAKCLRRADGSVDCFLALVQDITGRKQAEAALRHSRDELSAANAALAKAARLKDEFLASMSHELRTPLTGILNLSEALQEQVYGPLNEKQLKSLHTIEESGRHLLELINDILDLSKIEAGQFDLQLEKCVVGDVCHSSLQLIKGIANKKRQQISFTINPPAIDLCADARRLKQMLFNLLDNAVKFTPVGGNIGLQVEGDTEAGVVRFSVWDTGIGIAAEDLPQLFRPFIQLDSRLARQYSGTGLGLSLVQRMADLHGGSVSVESTPGQGSRFTITLPWHTAAPTVVTTIQNQGKQNTPRQLLAGKGPGVEAGRLPPRILLVDDNETNISTFADYLQSKGYGVILARQGSEALQAVQAMKPELILLDIQMPGMDGLEVMQRIRTAADVKVAATPIIALTALAMPGDRERCLATGANDYLCKPVNFHRLIQVIETQLVQP
jgi:PAS domain S-box-containing protein